MHENISVAFKKRFFVRALLIGAAIAFPIGGLLYVLNINAQGLRQEAAQALKPTATPSQPVAAQSPGCWEVVGVSNVELLQLSAHWHRSCPVASVQVAAPGEYDYPVGAFYLPAWPGKKVFSGEPVDLRLTVQLTGASDLEGSLLFLPVTADGKGYVLTAAGWRSADDELRLMMSLGHAGATPPSVLTSAGRVYQAAHVAPLIDSLSADDGSDAEEGEDAQADE